MLTHFTVFIWSFCVQPNGESDRSVGYVCFSQYRCSKGPSADFTHIAHHEEFFSVCENKLTNDILDAHGCELQLEWLLKAYNHEAVIVVLPYSKMQTAGIGRGISSSV